MHKLLVALVRVISILYCGKHHAAPGSQISTLEQQLREQAQELQRLLDENSKLKVKKDVLLAAISTQDEQLAVMQQVQQLKLTRKQKAKLNRSLSTAASVSQTREAAGIAATSSPTVSEETNNGVSSAPAAEQEQVPSVSPLVDDDTGLVKFGELLQLYRQYVRQAGQLLLAYNVVSDGGLAPDKQLRGSQRVPGGDTQVTDICAKLQQLATGFPVKLRECVAFSPLQMLQIRATNIETGVTTGIDADESHWLSVATAIGFTEELWQRQSAAYELYLRGITRVLEERAQLQTQLKTYAAGLSNDGTSTAPTGGSEHAARVIGATSLDDESSQRYKELVKKLDTNLKREDNMIMVFECATFMQLDDMQLAKACVHSYPYWPSMVMIVGTQYELKKGRRPGAGWTLKRLLQ